MQDINSAKLLHSYEKCKNIAILKYESAGRWDVLVNLKNEYKGVINSPRTLEYIKNLDDLFKILEKRSELSSVDVHVLEHVYGILNIKTEDLKDHRKLIDKEQKKKIPDNKLSARVQDIKQTTYKINKPSKLSRPTTSKNDENFNPSGRRLSERVINEICTRVGASWKEFARYLRVRECVIHDISQDPRLTDNEAKAKVMLLEYERLAFPEELKVKLLKALRLSGRMDIHDDVQKLFLREV